MIRDPGGVIRSTRAAVRDTRAGIGQGTRAGSDRGIRAGIGHGTRARTGEGANGAGHGVRGGIPDACPRHDRSAGG